jgi:two-component system response regulator DesR
MGEMVRVAAAHGQHLFARAVCAALAAHDLEVVGIAESADEAIGLVDELGPDLLMLDLALAGSLEALEVLRDSGVQVVALAPKGAAEKRGRAADAGVAAFVKGDANAQELAEALGVLALLGDGRP